MVIGSDLVWFILVWFGWFGFVLFGMVWFGVKSNIVPNKGTGQSIVVAALAGLMLW